MLQPTHKKCFFPGGKLRAEAGMPKIAEATCFTLQVYM